MSQPYPRDLMSHRLFVGVDGGQSSTLAVLCDEDGRLLGAGLGGPSNHIHQPGGHARLESAIRTSIGAALMEANLSETIEIEACSFGMTGGWEYVPPIIASFLKPKITIAEPDYVTSQVGAFAGGPGVIIIGGTGSIAYGVNEAGSRERAGGWGYIMGDEGSGYDIGRRALVAAARMEDGRGPSTAILPALLQHFHKESLWDIRTGVYNDEISRADIARIAVLVSELSARSDSVASQILEIAAEELADIAWAVVIKLGLESQAMVSPIGGVFQAKEPLLYLFQEKLSNKLPGTQVIPARYPPVLGAILMAFQASKIAIDPEVHRNLEMARDILKTKRLKA